MAWDNRIEQEWRAKVAAMYFALKEEGRKDITTQDVAEMLIGAEPELVKETSDVLILLGMMEVVEQAFRTIAAR